MKYREIKKAVKNAICKLGGSEKILVELYDIKYLIGVIKKQDKAIAKYKQKISVLEKRNRKLEKGEVGYERTLCEYA